MSSDLDHFDPQTAASSLHTTAEDNEVAKELLYRLHTDASLQGGIDDFMHHAPAATIPQQNPNPGRSSKPVRLMAVASFTHPLQAVPSWDGVPRDGAQTLQNNPSEAMGNQLALEQLLRNQTRRVAQELDAAAVARSQSSSLSQQFTLSDAGQRHIGSRPETSVAQFGKSTSVSMKPIRWKGMASAEQLQLQPISGNPIAGSVQDLSFPAYPPMPQSVNRPQEAFLDQLFTSQRDGDQGRFNRKSTAAPAEIEMVRRGASETWNSSSNGGASSPQLPRLTFHQQLSQLFRHVGVTKTDSQIEDILWKWVGDEDELLRQLQLKYNISNSELAAVMSNPQSLATNPPAMERQLSMQLSGGTSISDFLPPVTATTYTGSPTYAAGDHRRLNQQNVQTEKGDTHKTWEFHGVQQTPTREDSSPSLPSLSQAQYSAAAGGRQSTEQLPPVSNSTSLLIELSRAYAEDRKAKDRQDLRTSSVADRHPNPNPNSMDIEMTHYPTRGEDELEQPLLAVPQPTESLIPSKARPAKAPPTAAVEEHAEELDCSCLNEDSFVGSIVRTANFWILVSLLLALMVILLVAYSFKYVDRNTLAVMRFRTTGALYRDPTSDIRVFPPGRYFLSPMYQSIAFNSSVRVMALQLSAESADGWAAVFNWTLNWRVNATGLRTKVIPLLGLEDQVTASRTSTIGYWNGSGGGSTMQLPKGVSGITSWTLYVRNAAIDAILRTTVLYPYEEIVGVTPAISFAAVNGSTTALNNSVPSLVGPSNNFLLRRSYVRAVNEAVRKRLWEIGVSLHSLLLGYAPLPSAFELMRQKMFLISQNVIRNRFVEQSKAIRLETKLQATLYTNQAAEYKAALIAQANRSVAAARDAQVRRLEEVSAEMYEQQVQVLGVGTPGGAGSGGSSSGNDFLAPEVALLMKWNLLLDQSSTDGNGMPITLLDFSRTLDSANRMELGGLP